MNQSPPISPAHQHRSVQCHGKQTTNEDHRGDIAQARLSNGGWLAPLLRLVQKPLSHQTPEVSMKKYHAMVDNDD